jgi:hypothetical protein
MLLLLLPPLLAAAATAAVKKAAAAVAAPAVQRMTYCRTACRRWGTPWEPPPFSSTPSAAACKASRTACAAWY